MIKNILMDVDGTLLDTKDCFYRSLKKTLQEYGMESMFDESTFGMSVDQALKAMCIQSIPGIKERWEHLFEIECEHVNFYDGMEETMSVLSQNQIRIVIVTSRSRCTAQPLCECSVLSPYIEGYVAAEDTILHKPNPEPIFKAIDLLEAKKEETIYIGDSFWDYCAASSAGIRFGHAGWNKDSQNKSYDMVFYHPLEMIALIGEGNDGISKYL